MGVLLAVQLLHVAQHIPMNIDVCKLLIFAGKQRDHKQKQEEGVRVYLHVAARCSRQGPLVSRFHDREPS